MHRTYALSLALLCALVPVPDRPVQAQVAVYDALNHEANIFSGIQEFLSQLQLVAQTVHMVTELTPYSDSGLGDLDADLTELQGIVSEAGVVLYNISEVERQSRAVFGLDSAPSSMRELQARAVQTVQHIMDQRAHLNRNLRFRCTRKLSVGP